MRFIVTLACSAVFMLLAAGTSFGTPSAPRDYCEVHGKTDPQLCAYDPSTIGYTHDGDDNAFMDFTVSVRYQLFPFLTTSGLNALNSGLGDNSALYFAFTGRFGQYIGTRESSPVVEKLFNPKVFWRLWPYHDDHRSRLDFAFAHESNGQSIDSPEEYQAAQATTKDREAVKDQLSRGWDYWEVSWEDTLLEREMSTSATLTVCGGGDCGNDPPECPSCTSSLDGRLKRTSVVYKLAAKLFLPHGPLQGAQENYNSWENDPQGKRFNQVNGYLARVQLIQRTHWTALGAYKVGVRYETGIRDTFRYNTWRLEAGAKLYQLPVSVWWQTGYNSDLAQYYKKVRSRGIQAEICSF